MSVLDVGKLLGDHTHLKVFLLLVQVLYFQKLLEHLLLFDQPFSLGEAGKLLEAKLTLLMALFSLYITVHCALAEHH